MSSPDGGFGAGASAFFTSARIVSMLSRGSILPVVEYSLCPMTREAASPYRRQRLAQSRMSVA